MRDNVAVRNAETRTGTPIKEAVFTALNEETTVYEARARLDVVDVTLKRWMGELGLENVRLCLPKSVLAAHGGNRLELAKWLAEQTGQPLEASSRPAMSLD